MHPLNPAQAWPSSLEGMYADQDGGEDGDSTTASVHAQIDAVPDTQHRDIPASFDDLLALRKEELREDPAIANDPALVIDKLTIPARDKYPIPAIVVQRKQHESLPRSPQRPVVLFYHGGGRVMGNAWVGLASVIDAVKDLDAIAVSIEYRLSPEVPGTVAIEDCYSALEWVAGTGGRSHGLDIDPDRLVLAGVSAGAGLAAGTELLARDRGGPKVRAQMLACPMLDDRMESLSCRQFDGNTTRGFYTGWGKYAWSCVLGCQLGPDEDAKLIYVAPGRAEDLSGLPPVYIDAGTNEPFRDEALAYVSRLWACGVAVDLHIWAGGCHGFDLFYKTDVGVQAFTTRSTWLKRILSEDNAT